MEREVRIDALWFFLTLKVYNMIFLSLIFKISQEIRILFHLWKSLVEDNTNN